MWTIKFGFGSTALSYCFNSAHFGFLGPFLAIFWVGVRLKTIFGPTNVDYQFWILKYSPIFLFSVFCAP